MSSAVAVFNLAREVTVERLRESFHNASTRCAQTLRECLVPVDSRGQSLGYGIVQYDAVEAADAAARMYRSCLYSQQSITTLVYDPGAEIREADGQHTAYVSNLPFDCTEDDLCALFYETQLMGTELAPTRSRNARGVALVHFCDATALSAACTQSGIRMLRRNTVTIAPVTPHLTHLVRSLFTLEAEESDSDDDRHPHVTRRARGQTILLFTNLLVVMTGKSLMPPVAMIIYERRFALPVR